MARRSSPSARAQRLVLRNMRLTRLQLLRLERQTNAPLPSVRAGERPPGPVRIRVRRLRRLRPGHPPRRRAAVRAAGGAVAPARRRQAAAPADARREARRGEAPRAAVRGVRRALAAERQRGAQEQLAAEAVLIGSWWRPAGASSSLVLLCCCEAKSEHDNKNPDCCFAKDGCRGSAVSTRSRRTAGRTLPFVSCFGGTPARHAGGGPKNEEGRRKKKQEEQQDA